MPATKAFWVVRIPRHLKRVVGYLAANQDAPPAQIIEEAILEYEAAHKSRKEGEAINT